MEINYLFFVSDEFISRKQFLQIIYTGYDTQSSVSLLDSFNLTDPFETQNVWINLFTQSSYIPSLRLENLNVTLFGTFLSTSGNPQCWKSLLQYPIPGGHSVLDISVSSTDSYSITVTLTKQCAPSVFSWLAWRRPVLAAVFHNIVLGQIFLYLYLTGWNQLFLVFHSKSNYFFFSADSDSDIAIYIKKIGYLSKYLF